MVPLKKCNWFTGHVSDLSTAVYQIINFLEIDGRNPLLIAPPKRGNQTQAKENKSATSLVYLIDNQISFKTFEEFKEILENKSNLFRVDLLVFDFWTLSSSEIIEFKKEIDKLNIQHIIAAQEYYYKSSDDICDYHVRQEYKNLEILNIYITDKINNWTQSLQDLKISYLRDKKLDNLFDIE